MNKQEQAIEVLISRYNSGVIRSRTNDDEWRLATETAIAALREKAERERGCAYEEVNQDSHHVWTMIQLIGANL